MPSEKLLPWNAIQKATGTDIISIVMDLTNGRAAAGETMDKIAAHCEAAYSFRDTLYCLGSFGRLSVGNAALIALDNETTEMYRDAYKQTLERFGAGIMSAAGGPLP